MKCSAKYQQGISTIGWAITLGIVTFITMFVLKLFPLYLENYTVESALGSMAKEARAQGNASPSHLRAQLLRNFEVNNVRSVDRRDIDIKRDGNLYIIAVDYEVREYFVGNIDFLVSFHNRVEVPAN